MTIFEQIKERVDIVDAAKMYGLTVNRHNKALCPFHNEDSPSLSFYGNNTKFTCFGCGKHGDVFDLIGSLTNKEPLVVAAELNSLYHLGFDLNAPPDRLEMLKRQLARERQEAFLRWILYAGNTYAAYFRQLREWRETKAPRTMGDPLDPLFMESLVMTDRVEYILDTVFINGDTAEKAKFALSYSQEVDRLARRMKGEVDKHAGRNNATVVGAQYLHRAA